MHWGIYLLIGVLLTTGIIIVLVLGLLYSYSSTIFVPSSLSPIITFSDVMITPFPSVHPNSYDKHCVNEENHRTIKVSPVHKRARILQTLNIPLFASCDLVTHSDYWSVSIGCPSETAFGKLITYQINSLDYDIHLIHEFSFSLIGTAFQRAGQVIHYPFVAAPQFTKRHKKYQIPDGSIFSFDNDEMKRCDWQTGKPMRKEGGIFCVSPNRTTIAISCMNGDVDIFDIHSGTLRQHIQSISSYMGYLLQFLTDDRLLLIDPVEKRAVVIYIDKLEYEIEFRFFQSHDFDLQMKVYVYQQYIILTSSLFGTVEIFQQTGQFYAKWTIDHVSSGIEDACFYVVNKLGYVYCFRLPHDEITDCFILPSGIYPSVIQLLDESHWIILDGKAKMFHLIDQIVT